MFKRMYGMIFQRKNGKTRESAQALDTDRMPSYLQLGIQYVVVDGPILDHVVQFVQDKIYSYLVRDLNGGSGEVFYITTPYELPTNFYLRMITAWHTIYEILDSKDEGLPRQIIRAQQKYDELKSQQNTV